MKRTLFHRAIFLCALFALLAGLLIPWAGAVTYKGVPEISLEAQSALLIDLDTEQVLYEQDANATRYPASITKIMTCLLTLEAIGRGELSMDTVVTISEDALADLSSDSSTANLKAGEEITVNDLLYCLMLSSANEAANALAIAVAGDIPSFVERMNQRAEELGMENTHFVNPHGLHDDDHYTTAWDIFQMAQEGMTHAPFREIVSTGRYETAATNMSDARILLNTNGLLARYKYPGYTYSGTIGIKTGSTGQAGYCLVTACKRKGHTLVAMVLGCENPTDKWGNPVRKQFSESRRLLDWAFTNFSAASLLQADSYLQEIPVRNSFQASHVVLQPVESVKPLVPGEYDPELRELRLHLNEEEAAAPIAVGDVLGTVEVIYDGQEYGTVDLAAVSDVSYSPFLAFVSGVNTVLGNIYVRLLLLISLVLIVVGVSRRYVSEQHQLRKEARKRKQEVRRQEAQARKEQTLREQAAYEAKQAEKRRQAEEARKKKEEAEKLHRQQELERQRQKEEAARRQEDRERRRQQELSRRWQQEQERWQAEQREQERRYGSRSVSQRQYYDRRPPDRSYRQDSRDRSYQDRDRRDHRRNYDYWDD